MNRRVYRHLSVPLIAGLMVLAGWGFSPRASHAQLGEKVYEEQRCRLCHSIAGEGNARNPLDGVGTRLDQAVIRKWIVAPKEMDPKVKKKAYDSLPADQLDALVEYLCSLKAAD